MIDSAKRLEQVPTYYFAKKLKEIAQLNAAGEDIINLGIGSPDLDPPVSVNQALKRGLAAPKAHQYQSYYGLPELRTAFANFYQQYFSVELDSQLEILPLIGSKEGIMHIAMSFLDPGDEVLVPNPGYPSYSLTTLLAGGFVRNFNLTEGSSWLPDFDKIENQDLEKVKLMWVNYPNMPTGQKASKVLFEKLVAFGHKHNILICHDNPYAFILNERPLSILEVDGAKETALELCSLSKGHNMAGWRMGAVLAHQDYISSIVKFKSNMDSGMFKPVQLAAIEALKSGPEWFTQQNEVYTARRILVWELFDLIHASYEKDTAGLFVWAKVPSETGLYWSDVLLSKAKVFITPGFIFGSNGESHLRISLCNSVIIIRQAINRIKSIL